MFKRMFLTCLLVLGLVVGLAYAYDTEFYSYYGEKSPECFMSLDYTKYEGAAPSVWVIKYQKPLFERKYLNTRGDLWRDATTNGEDVIPCCAGGTVSPAWLCPEEEPVVVMTIPQVEPAPSIVVIPIPEEEPAPVFKPKTFIVHFDFDSDIITKDQEDILLEAANYAAEFGDAIIKLEASCDYRGTREYNIELGERRATAVEHWLIENSVTPNRFAEVINHGDNLSPFRIMKGIFCPDCWEDRYVKIGFEKE